LVPRLRLDDPDELRRAYVDERLSLSAIAEMAGCSYASVRQTLLEYGVQIRRTGPMPIAKLRDETWLRAQVRAGRSASDIAGVLGCAEATARSALRKAGLSPRPNRGRPALQDPSFLERAYITDRRSVRSIAEEIGCSKDAVLHALRRQGVPIRSRGRRSADPSTPLAAMDDTLVGDGTTAPASDELLVDDTELGTDVSEPTPERVPVIEPTTEVDDVRHLQPESEEREGEPAEESAIADAAAALDRDLRAAHRGGMEPSERMGHRPEPRTSGRAVPGRVELEIEKIETKTFPVSRRGYDRVEVDSYLRSIANDYRLVMRKAREAVAEAQRTAAARPSASFDDVGGRVAAVLASAAQAAEEIKAEAEDQASAIRQQAEEETAHIRESAAQRLLEAERIKSASEEEATALTASANTEAAEILASARHRAARIEEEAQQRATTIDRTARANVDAVIAEARREYEHLRSVQQQCLDRLAAVEFLARHAREGMSEAADQAFDERL
jgi:DivIVA domain-containing protein